jgi:hypothetical protein
MNLNISANDVPNAWCIMNSLFINVELKNNTSFSYTIQHINVLLCIRILSKNNYCMTSIFTYILHIELILHLELSTQNLINGNFDR